MPHGELNNELELHEVPVELTDELKQHFKNVKFELDTDINSETQTLKCNFTNHPNPDLVERQALDPKTFTPILAKGYIKDHYLVRINEVDNGVIVRRVLINEYFEAIKT